MRKHAPVLALSAISAGLCFTAVGVIRAHAQAGNSLPPSATPRDSSPVELSTISPNVVHPPVDTSKPLHIISGGIVAGAILYRPFPRFPPKTNCLRVSGTVIMHVIIGTDGHVKTIDVISGAEVMRQPNIDATKQSIYRPFQMNGQPVEVETTMVSSVQFNLDGC